MRSGVGRFRFFIEDERWQWSDGAADARGGTGACVQYPPPNDRPRRVAHRVVVVAARMCDEHGVVIGTHGYCIDVTPAEVAYERRISAAVADVSEIGRSSSNPKGRLALLYGLDGDAAFELLRGVRVAVTRFRRGTSGGGMGTKGWAPTAAAPRMRAPVAPVHAGSTRWRSNTCGMAYPNDDVHARGVSRRLDPLGFLLWMIRGIRDHRWFPDEAAARSPRGPGAGLGRVGIATGGVSLWPAARVLVGCANVPVARWLDDGQPGLQQRRVDHLVTVAIRQPFFHAP